MSQPEENQDLFVTVEDHCVGFKKLAIETRAGATEEIILHAPSRRAVRVGLPALGSVSAEEFVWRVVALCLDKRLVELHGERWLDLLTPDSAALVEVTAHCLTFGSAWQKKMLSLLDAAPTRLANCGPSNDSEAAAGPATNSMTGAGPSSGSTLPSPSSKS